MTKRARSLLRVPQGTEGFYLEDAYRHRKVTAHLEQFMYSWGYLPVQTPVFDFFDVYEPLLSGGDERRVYRLIDREGDLLLLRSDITLFLARQMGMVLTEDDLPTRVCYFDTILRHQNAEDISKNEFFQAGAELMGVPGSDGDLEIILLMQETLTQLPLPEKRFHIGSRSLIDAALQGMSSQDQATARKAIAVRDRAELRRHLRQFSVPEKLTTFYCDLFSLIGTRDELKAMWEFGSSNGIIGEEVGRQIGYLHEIFEMLEELDAAASCRVDLSEVGAQSYYTGIVFQTYMDGFDAAVASGGRYDRLLSNFGLSAPSVGFSMMVRKIENVLAGDARFNPPQQPQTTPGSTFAERYRQARAIRQSGRSAVL